MSGRSSTVFVVVLLVSGCMQPKTHTDVHRAEPPTAAALVGVGWASHVGDGVGLYVSAAEQRIWVIQNGAEVTSYACSTAARGLGQVEGSRQTPLGWHVVADKIGAGLPVGAVFKERQFTGEIWAPAPDDGHDRILTRIIRLRGTEPYLNTGPGIDSYDRYIYIHGTSGEDRLGSPASAGCIRMANRDVIALFDRIQTGTPVYISAS